VAQSLAHAAAPELNRPIDWSRQIQFEPGIIGRFSSDKLLIDESDLLFGVQLLPGYSLAAGNVLTEGTASLRGRFGLRLDKPWTSASALTHPELALEGGLTGRAIAHDLFLDGNTLRDSPKVDRTPFVLERDLSITLRSRYLKLGYGVRWVSARYSGGPSHIWSSMTGGVVFTR
jgi:hypothetical protein